MPYNLQTNEKNKKEVCYNISISKLYEDAYIAALKLINNKLDNDPSALLNYRATVDTFTQQALNGIALYLIKSNYGIQQIVNSSGLNALVFSIASHRGIDVDTAMIEVMHLKKKIEDHILIQLEAVLRNDGITTPTFTRHFYSGANQSAVTFCRIEE